MKNINNNYELNNVKYCFNLDDVLNDDELLENVMHDCIYSSDDNTTNLYVFYDNERMKICLFNDDSFYNYYECSEEFEIIDYSLEDYQSMMNDTKSKLIQTLRNMSYLKSDFIVNLCYEILEDTQKIYIDIYKETSTKKEEA